MWASVQKTLAPVEDVKDVIAKKTVEVPQLPFIGRVNETPQLPRQEHAELTQLVLVERIQDRTADQMVDEHSVDVPIVQEMEKLVPQGRVQHPTVEHASVP